MREPRRLIMATVTAAGRRSLSAADVIVPAIRADAITAVVDTVGVVTVADATGRATRDATVAVAGVATVAGKDLEHYAQVS